MVASSKLWGQYEAQHVANMAYAIALLQHEPSKAWIESLLQVPYLLYVIFDIIYAHSLYYLLPYSRRVSGR